eukprot:578605-Rhodomonas_salina.4
MTLEGHKEKIVCAEFDSRGRNICSIAADNQIRIWRVMDGCAAPSTAPPFCTMPTFLLTERPDLRLGVQAMYKDAEHEGGQPNNLLHNEHDGPGPEACAHLWVLGRHNHHLRSGTQDKVIPRLPPPHALPLPIRTLTHSTFLSTLICVLLCCLLSALTLLGATQDADSQRTQQGNQTAEVRCPFRLNRLLIRSVIRRSRALEAAL